MIGQVASVSFVGKHLGEGARHVGIPPAPTLVAVHVSIVTHVVTGAEPVGSSPSRFHVRELHRLQSFSLLKNRLFSFLLSGAIFGLITYYFKLH